MAEVASDVATVRGVLPTFEYTPALTEVTHAAEMRAAKEECAAAKAQLADSRQDSQKRMEEVEASLTESKEVERTRLVELEEKVTILVDAQVEFQNAEKEHQQVEEAGREEAEVGHELREALKQNEDVAQIMPTLIAGTWKSDKERTKNLEAVKDYLKEVQVEQTLAAAADGLGVAPDKRGSFDKMAIDSITEALREKRLAVEERLEARRPAEKEAQAELLGLWALKDVMLEKATAAEAEHKKVEDEIKASKSSMRALKQQVTKAAAEVAQLEEKLKLQEAKAQSVEAAESALTRLVVAAQAEAAEAEAKRAAEAEAAEAEAKRVAEEAAAAAAAQASAEAEAKAVEEAAAAFEAEETQPAEVKEAPATDSVDEAEEISAPPAKRLCTEESKLQAAQTTAKQDFMAEFQVASPARAQRAFLNMDESI